MGRVDVDAMLAEMSQQQLMEWRAALDIVGVDDQWMQAEVICQEIHRIALAHAGSKDEPPPRKAFNPNAIPCGKKRTESGKYLSGDEAKQAARKRAGL